MKVRKIEILDEDGDTLESIARRSIELARTYKTHVLGLFEGTMISATERQMPQDVMNDWNKLRERIRCHCCGQTLPKLK